MTDVTPDPTERPGDEAAPEAAGAGENVCPHCGGSGQVDDGSRCELCSGTGRVTEAIGGG
jgi:RecJ-like exonuclease